MTQQCKIYNKSMRQVLIYEMDVRLGRGVRWVNDVGGGGGGSYEIQ